MSPCRLPRSFNEEDLKKMMRDRRYVDSSHPEHQPYQAMVQDGFQKLYPETQKTDEFGRPVRDESTRRFSDGKVIYSGDPISTKVWK